MIKRKVNNSVDLLPDMHHKFEANLVYSKVKNKKVLDIGCWTGQFLSLIEARADTYGIDPEKSAIAFASKKRMGNYIVGSGLALPYQSEMFDIVTMWDVIEHVPAGSELKVLNEAFRVLKLNGTFALSTVTTHPLSILLDPAYFLVGHRHYSSKSLYDLLSKVGFSIDKTVYSGGLWTLIRENINLITKHIFKKNLELKFLEQIVKKEYKGKGFYQIHVIASKKNK